MFEPDELEVWARQRAQQIFLQEGVQLMQAAQWLDKKQTLKNSTRLRNAICQSLIEAVQLRDMVQPNFEHEPSAQRASLIKPEKS
ncbi:MAG: hypothetical protein ACOH2J_19755 [Allorhizobium sp.]